MSKDFRKGMIVSALCKIDNEWYKARVLGIHYQSAYRLGKPVIQSKPYQFSDDFFDD